MRGHVDGLSSGVSRRVRRSRVVRAEDVQEAFPLEVLGQPDKTGAKHGVGRGEKVELEGFNRGAGVDDIGGELVWDLGGCWGLMKRAY